jgi:signal transduction histidine kinase
MKTYNVSVLFVEDDHQIRETIEKILDRRIEQLYMAKNGVDGLELFKAYNPQIVITDIQMPQKNGLEMLKEIKEINTKTKSVIMTAFTEPEYFIQAIELGVDGFIIKPIHLERLFATISKCEEMINTEQKLIKYEQNILENNKLLNELNITKDRFFSIIAHDLKGPFSSLIGFSELLLNDYKNLSAEEIHDYHKMIYTTANNSHNLLENLLEWSRSQTGKITFNPTKINISQIVQNVADLLISSANEKNIVFLNEISPSVFAFADDNMVKTILRNLLNNAIKFTSKYGIIKLTSQQLQNKSIQTDTPNISMIEVSVKDSGIGISTDNLNKLFKIDQKISTKGTNNEKGTGLGLIICKEFIDKNGGQITIESYEGKGTTLKFTLPEAL